MRAKRHLAELTRGGRLGRAAAITAGLMLVLACALYYPHDPNGVAGRALARWLALQAQVVGALLAACGAAVSVQGNLVLGRFPMAVVLDCAALDVVGFFGAAVLGFPAPWRRKLAGLLAGSLFIAGLNVLRIALLYPVGARWPALFAPLHTEALQLLMVAAGIGAFVAWAGWALPAPAPVAENAGVRV